MWEFYLTKWHGRDDITEELFARYSDMAMAFINKMTFGRAQKVVDNESEGYVLECIQKCLCAVVDCFKKYECEELPAPGIASENTDGYSVTYQSAAELRAQKNLEAEELCRIYLPVELLYRGA